MKYLVLLMLTVGIFIYPVKILQIKDADTFKTQFEIFPDTYMVRNVRLQGCDAWETSKRRRSVNVTDAEVVLGHRAKKFVEEKIGEANQTTLIVVDIDMYGRVLGNIMIDGQNLCDLLIKNCHGLPYDGKTYGEVAEGCLNPRL